MPVPHGRVNEAISFVDNELLGIPGVGTTYVVRGDEVAIVETGTSLCAPAILHRLGEIGVRPAEVCHIVLTHVHLDHAGGAGVLVDAMPDARVYIHSLTAPHLVDPARLLSSAERALGDLFARHGTIVPLPPEKLVPAEVLDLDLGRGVSLRAIPTPGHSSDHLAYYETSTGALFTGDSVGISLPAFGFLGPVAPPPTLDVEAQHATFQKLLDLPIEHLLFSHWGPGPDAPHDTIRRLRDSFDRMDHLVRDALARDHVDEPAIIRAMLPDHPLPPDGEWVITGWLRMNIKGMVRYWTKRGQQERA